MTNVSVLKRSCETLAICYHYVYNNYEVIMMARTSNVFARVEPEVKEQAETILNQLGIPMSNAVGMFLRQIVLQRGIPFEMKLPVQTPLVLQNLTQEQLNAELDKGMQDIRNGNVFSADEIEAELHKVYGI